MSLLHSNLRKALLGSLAIAATFGLSGVAQAAKDQLVIGATQYPSNLNPNHEAITSKDYILGFVFRQATAFNGDGKNVCLICTELPTIENGLAKIETRDDGSKGLAITFKIQPKAAWGDGVPVTAKDVLFTWNLGRQKEAGFLSLDAYARYEKIDVVDDKTVILHTKTVRSDYNEFGRFRILPEHIEGPIVKSVGVAEYPKNTAYNRASTTPGLYNGPYLIKEVQSGAAVVLEPNPHWYGKAPYFKRITIRTIENSAALQANVLSGDVDFAPGDGVGLTTDQVIELEKSSKGKFDFIYKPGYSYEHIDLQKNNPILQDKRVRQALLYSINRKALTDKLFEGKEPVADNFLAPISPLYNKDVSKFAFDPKKAAALLDEAGWKVGADKVRVNAQGQRLSLDFGTTAGNKVRELVQQVLQSQWRDVGVEVVIKNEPARTFFGETARKRTYGGLALYAWTSDPDEPPVRNLHTSAIPVEANNWAGNNIAAFSNAEFDAALDKILVELDPAARKKLWADLQRIYVEELPVLPLFFRVQPFALPKWLKGVEPTGSGVSTHWAENWHAI
ncbi:peptide ABC transporter substrate-binding protein [Microvirga flavescens]|uniref:peptide ABC transporter substrate-binding protein n=1 Tax=Microvirga flavescens TaxID=2249811 RepID=UPI0013002ED0|nr:peptide ABC transporter substrate-binding protein [Microvirga flavescens]